MADGDPAATGIRDIEVASLGSLKPHPRNYRAHPEGQLAHLAESLRQHGFYRNVVVASDGTILAGHGIVQAAQRAGLGQVPVVRLPIAPDDPRALKVLAADNELGRFAEDDDRMLSEILKEVKEADLSGLLGTGYDDAALAALLMVTRPASEIKSFDEAAEWVGMPEYEEGGSDYKLIVTFDGESERAAFVEAVKALLSLKAAVDGRRVWSARYPADKKDVASVRFEPAGG